MNNFMGKNGFIWWQGVVEDRQDPLYLGRCRVRILGWDTDDKTKMPTEDLPWAFPIQPITSAAQTGVGISPTGPVEGTWVVGFYRDGEEAQERVFFGTLGGIPQTQGNFTKGFSDPRVTSKEVQKHELYEDYETVGPRLEYDAAPDRRVPTAPAGIDIYTGGSKLSQDKIDEKNAVGNYEHREIAAHGVGPNLLTPVQVILKEYTVKSRYPNIDYLGEPTTPRPALGRFGNFKGITSHTGDGLVKQKVEWSKITQNITRSKNQRTSPQTPRSTWSEISPAAINQAKYPYNHVHQSESGHIIEIDDTPGAERLHRYHRAGTFEEIGQLGQRITKVMNEDQTFKMMNSFEKIFGDSLVSIDGDLDIVSQRGYHHTTGSFNVDSRSAIRMSGIGQALFQGRGGVTIDSGSGSLTLRGQNLIHDFKDSSSTQKIKGNLVNKVGGKFSTRASGINLGSRGSTSISAGGSYNVVTGDNINEAATNLAGIFGAPARSFKSGIGEIIFETALPGPTGAFAFNAGIAGLLGSITMDQLGQISLNVGPGGSIAKLTLGATGIELSYLAGLAKIELNAAGVSINGLTSSMTGTVQAKVDGALVNVEASGINTVKGSLVMIN
jgi:hypothetical protein